MNLTNQLKLLRIKQIIQNEVLDPYYQSGPSNHSAGMANSLFDCFSFEVNAILTKKVEVIETFLAVQWEDNQINH